MRISFDLDGVIAEGHHWFFRLMEGVRRVDLDLANLAELEYYSSRPLKFHPNLFLAPGDQGFIITARKPRAKKITESWLKRYGIILPVVYVDEKGEIDWNSYQEASRKAGELKAKVIKELGVDIHFDNNPGIVQKLREEIPQVKVVLIGGEELIS